MQTDVGAPGGGFVLGVLGASGGVGASTLATACAVRGAAAGRDTVLVDAHPWGGGLDIQAGTDGVPGLRWPDLQGVRGDVDPGRLVGELPVGGTGFRCLSWGPQAPGDTPTGPDPVLAALRAAAAVTVLDLPRPAISGSGHRQWWAACDRIVMVMDCSVVGIGAAVVMGQAVPELAGVVVRPHVAVEDAVIEVALGAEVLASLPVDRGVARCLDRGRAVASESGVLAAVAETVLEVMLPGVRHGS